MIIRYGKLLILMALVYGNGALAATAESPEPEGAPLVLSKSTTVPPLERSRTLLTEDEITLRLAQLPGWARNASGHIYKNFEISLGGLSPELDAAIVAAMKTLNHHALQIRREAIYTIETWTHCPLGITELDFELAKAIDAIFSTPRSPI